jgi:hypothetical protein
VFVEREFARHPTLSVASFNLKRDDGVPVSPVDSARAVIREIVFLGEPFS